MKHSLRTLPNTTCRTAISSPVGELTLLISNAGLHGILWDNEIHLPPHQDQLAKLLVNNQHPICIQTKTELTEYFAGKRRQFSVPLILNGSDFQKRCWQQLQQIKYGSTISYAKQAEALGNKNKARAVGMANHVNPIPIIVPCHRVIGSNGKLTGFAAGLERKQYLLDLEHGI